MRDGSRPHDLGGRTGFGAVPVGLDRPFSAHWKERALVLASLVSRLAGMNGDRLRHEMECLPADEYARLDNAGRWLRVAERCAADAGLVAGTEVTQRARCRADGAPAPDPATLPAPQERVSFPRPRQPHNKRLPPEGTAPRFAPGDAVTVAAPAPGGHTRLPAYLAGRRGVVERHHGYWVFPDTHAADGTEAPTWVYAVRFRAGDLWPDAGDHEVCADLFEPYLLP